MFDVESAIASWRRTFLGREGATEQQADELEDHLREQLGSLRALAQPGPTALSEEEAFLVASRRLGGTDAIAAEFVRCDPGATWRRRWIWMLCGYLGIGFAVTLISTLAAITSFATHSAGRTWMLAAYALALIAGTAACIAIARAVARADRPLPALFARGLRSRSGLVVTTLVAMALTAAVSPIPGLVLSRTVDSRMFGLMSTTRIDGFDIGLARVALWAVPFVALACLLARERLRTGEHAGRPIER